MTIKIQITNTADGGSRPCKVTTYDISLGGTTEDGRVFAAGEHVTAAEQTLETGESCDVWIHNNRGVDITEV